MSNFELYLISIGYHRYKIMLHKDKPFLVGCITDEYFLSNETNLDYRYIREWDDNKIPTHQGIVWGLNEVGKPATLIHPRPPVNDNEMNRILKENTPDEVYNMIYGKNVRHPA